MFLHIVMMAFTERANAQFFDTVQTYVVRMQQESKDLLLYHFGENTADRAQGYTHATCAAFVDADAHNAYQISPAHLAMKTYMAPYIARIVVYDGTVPPSQKSWSPTSRLSPDHPIAVKGTHTPLTPAPRTPRTRAESIPSPGAGASAAGIRSRAPTR